MTIIVKISTRKANVDVGTIKIDGQYSEQQIAAIANEAGGLSDLIAMGESSIPEDYEWTGDEEYEVIQGETKMTIENVLTYAKAKIIAMGLGTSSRGAKTMKTFEFWTDSGDEDDIEAATLEAAAEIASWKIKIREWNDGAWGIVKDSKTGEQMDVPSRAE